MLLTKKDNRVVTYAQNKLNFYEIGESLILTSTREFIGIQHISLADKFYFARHNELYCEMRLVRKFDSEILCLIDGAVGCDDGLVVYGQLELEHSCGVVGIAIADDVYVLDIRGRLVIYRDKVAIGSFDNLNMPMIYDQYLFVCDKNLLFCKTREAFAMFVEVKDDITDFCVTENLLAIQTGRKVLVVDINSKDVVGEYLCDSDARGKFFIDEFYNRLFVFDGSDFKIIDVPEIRPRGKIVFEEDRIFQKKVYEQQVDCNLEVEHDLNKDGGIIHFGGVRKDIGYENYDKKGIKGFKNLQARDNVKKLFDEDKNIELKALFEENENIHEKRKIHDYTKRIIGGHFFDEVVEFKARDDFKDNIKTNQDNKYENDFIEDYELRDALPPISKIFMPAMVRADDITLLSYNKTGYLIMKTQDEYNFIESIYHDKSKNGRKVQDYSRPRIGTIGNRGFLVTNGKVANFYGKTDWDVNAESRGEISLVGLGDVAVLIVSTIIEVYTLMGKLHSRFFVPGFARSLIVDNANIYLFLSDKVMLMTQKYKIYSLEKTHFLGPNYNFCSVSDDEIFYGTKSIYKICNGLGKEICTVKGIPLCVFTDYVISLDGKILPEPVVEYNKINDTIVSDEEIEESVESIEEIPVHFREESFSKTKRFDPRNF